MKLAMVADGRSPITRNWIRMLQPLGVEIHLISTFVCEDVPGTVETIHIPVAFSQYSGSQAGSGSRKPGGIVARFRGLAAHVRHWLGPWTVAQQSDIFREVIKRIQPDLVHAMRIPFEGMLASYTPAGIPLIISTWGNDLTLHAPSTPKMYALTRRTLRRADGLLSDTKRDVTLAEKWGFDPAKPTLVVPGNGGLDLDEMKRVTKGIKHADPPQVINPRGIRSYIRNDTFFKSIPLVLAKHPEVQFVCASMAGQKEALDWVDKLGIQKNVRLLPMIPQTELWKEFARSTISVSVSTHDGTPNSLLEAMALGCLPICGDLESIHEWVNDGENGLLVDSGDPRALAKAILHGLDDDPLRKRAAAENALIIRESANLQTVRSHVADFYTTFKR